MTDQTIQADTAEPTPELPDGEYAIVELLGRRTLVGRIEEVERFGSKLLRIEPIFGGALLEPVYHHGTALYGLTPCSKATALRCAPGADKAYVLPAPIRARLEPVLLAAPAEAPTDRDDEED